MEQSMPREELEELIGPIALKEFDHAPDYDKPKIEKWASGLRDLTDEDFVRECSSMILDSARMQSFRGNFEGIHARASACYHESKRRNKAAGHADDCRGDTLYQVGFAHAYRSQGHTPDDPQSCTCGTNSEVPVR